LLDYLTTLIWSFHRGVI